MYSGFLEYFKVPWGVISVNSSNIWVFLDLRLQFVRKLLNITEKCQATVTTDFSRFQMGFLTVRLLLNGKTHLAKVEYRQVIVEIPFGSGTPLGSGWQRLCPAIQWLRPRLELITEARHTSAFFLLRIFAYWCGADLAGLCAVLAIKY